MWRMVRGLLAGLGATVPMTVNMEAVRLGLPLKDQEPIPPRLILRDLLEKLNLEQDVNRRQELVLTMVSHFGYGATLGALYPLLADRIDLPPALKGMGYGMLVWAASYAGWLPALNILPPPQESSLGRNSLVISSHLIWGLVLGSLVGSPPIRSTQVPLAPTDETENEAVLNSEEVLLSGSPT